MPELVTTSSVQNLIAKVKAYPISDGACMLLVWMILSGKNCFTQPMIMTHYHVKKRTVRHYLYQFIDLDLVHRAPAHHTVAIYCLTEISKELRAQLNEDSQFAINLEDLNK